MVVLLAAPALRAEELLRGPYPFRKDNELTFHGGYGAGFGDTFAGAKGAVDYAYKLEGGLWLDLGVGFLGGACRPRQGDPACARKGNSAEVLAGIKYELRMNVPVVPYGKLVAGLAYLFPDEGHAALGVVVRAGIGAKYFFYEKIGVGPEIAVALGRADYQAVTGLSRALTSLDLLIGATVPF